MASKKKKEPVYQDYPGSLTLSQREEIISDDRKYAHHVLRYLHHITPSDDLVKERTGRSRMTFDYLSGEDVMSMLNETFLRGWSQEVTASETKVKQRKDGKWQGISVIRLRFEAEMPPPLSHFCQENIGSKRSVGGDEIDVMEYLEKSAITDALKRCVKTISMRLGLFLYYEEEEWKTDAALHPEGPPKVEPEPEKTNGYLGKKDLVPLWDRMKILAGNKEAAKSCYVEVIGLLGHTPNTVPADQLDNITEMARMLKIDEIITFATTRRQ